MDIFLRVDINLVAILLLGFVLIIAYKRLDLKVMVNKVFVITSLIVIIQLIFEIITCVINKQPGTAMIVLSNLFHVCLFVTAPILSYTWFILIKNIVVPYDRLQTRLNFLLLIPVAANVVLSILSPFFGLLFSVDSLNVYHRGDWFFVGAIITYIYMVLGIITIVVNRNKIIRHEFALFVFIALLPIIGGIFQSIFYGALLMWSMAAFALIVGYIFLQQRMVFLDNLTGCWNRDSFLYFLSLRLKRFATDPFGAIYFDIDGLKAINDKYGHLEGDKVLKIVSSIVKKELSMNDIIARMGGDEFVAIIDTDSKQVLEEVLDRIKNGFAEYNKNKTTEYSVNCSFGADIYNESHGSGKDFLNYVDTLMYRDKTNQKKG
ncbi:MAG: diguanylate cyclase [Bacilli bacterium]|nr:diguanylate cyclase [Bacilli bacterium]MBN2696555.1 diguanylate cyclase [Bacilli bacterium]